MNAVNIFKIGKVLPKIMKLMEDEGLNVAEVELVPKMLTNKIKENSELHEKTKQFTVHDGLFR